MNVAWLSDFFIAKPMDPNFWKFHSHKAPFRGGSVHSIKKKKASIQAKMTHQISVNPKIPRSQAKSSCENPPKFEWVRKGTFSKQNEVKEKKVSIQINTNQPNGSLNPIVCYDEIPCFIHEYVKMKQSGIRLPTRCFAFISCSWSRNASRLRDQNNTTAVNQILHVWNPIIYHSE